MSSSISEKIRKLMAIATNSGANANEAAAAAAMAADLAARYNIELDQVEASHKASPKQFKKGDYCPTTALPRDKQTHLILAGAVARLYGCSFLIAVHHNSNRILFIGQPHNIELCNSWLVYLWNAMARCNVEYARTRTFDTKKERYKADLAFRLQFASQVSSRLKDKLEAMRTQGLSSGGGTALVVSTWFDEERRQVAEWMQHNLSMGKPTQTRGKVLDNRAAVAGYNAGKNVGLHDQLGGKASAPGVKPQHARIG